MQAKNFRTAAVLFALTFSLGKLHAVPAGFPAQGDDLTQSLGQYQILVNPTFQAMMAGYPGYSATSKVLTSPLLFDGATLIGRSSPLLDGSPSDAAGVPVGSAGTLVSDGSLTVQPGGMGPANTREVHTELRSLNMVGGGAAVRAGTNATTRPISPGEVESLSGASGNSVLDFPARSFFDVFVEVDIPAGGSFPGATNMTNSLPLMIQNTNLTSFPPTVVYVHGMSTAVPIIFSSGPYAGQTFGLLQLAGHGVFQTNSATGISTTVAAATAQLQNTLAATTPAPVEPQYAAWAPGLTLANSNTMIFTNRGDDITTSLGTFRLAVNPAFQPYMAGYPGWDSTAKRLTSPLLFDPSTTIGRSSPLTNGSSADLTGVLVGSAGTLVASSNMTLLPPLFGGPTGTREVHTEIRSLHLSGGGAAVRAGTAATTVPKSVGEVQSLSGNSGDPYWDFPAKSFFDVFVDVDVPAGGSLPAFTLSNSVPLIVQNNDLIAFPPKVIYVHGNTTAVPVLFTTNVPALGAHPGDIFGIILLAGHGVGYNQNNTNDVAQFNQQMSQLPEQPVAPQYVSWAPNLTTNLTATNQPIFLTCSSNITVTASATSGGAYVTYSASASGGCSPPVFTFNPPSGSFFSVGTTIVSCTATDTCGDTANCSFQVTVNPSPTVICPSNLVVTTGSTNGAVVTFSAGLTGGCPPVTFTGSPYSSGAVFPLGVTYETVYVYDCNGYEGYCSFTVTVTDTNLPPLTVTCPSNITVLASSSSGAVVNFTVGTSGGCPPIYVSTSPYSSGATFPIGTTTENVYVYDSCVGSYVYYCSFNVTVNAPTQASVNEYFTTQAILPPPNSVYISPAQWHALYNNGIVIRDVRHRFFTQNYPLPPLGSATTETFSSEVDYQVSTDNGVTFQPASGTANVTVQVTHGLDNNGVSFFDTEMLQLNLAGTSFMLRESPTLQSTGQTTVRSVPGGYMISSFFDIFTEVSLDGGTTWTPANGPGHVEMRPDPKLVTPVPEPTPLLPPPNDHYISPAQWHALYAQGVVIKNVSHRLFTGSLLPPTSGVTNIHNFNSTLNLQVSSDGGNTFQFASVLAPVQVTVAGASSSSDNALYDTEMTSLNVTLPSGIMIRESPTEPSRGQTEIDTQADGTYRISSFFDIFTELSLDGGATWSPATNGPVRMQLTQQAPEVNTPTPNVPVTSTPYVSPQQWHALYANGIILTNVSHSGFTKTQSPPPPGGNQPENFGSTVSGLISLNGGASFQPFSAPANVGVQINSHSSLDNGTTRYFDTQMTQLNLSGGSLPGGIMIRQSPTLASGGRTSVRTDSTGGYHISSFFDVFTEISLDGGNTWSPSVTGPGTMSPGTTGNTQSVSVNCPSNITVTATSSSGATVYYTVTAGGGCSPPTVTANPPSGSTFPIGTTTVFTTASDTCGNSAQCSFTVTVVVPPISLNCPSNITVTATGPSGAVVYYTVTADGGCSPPAFVNAYPPSGSTFPIGPTTVYTSASDNCGTVTNCSFLVTVLPPVSPPIVLTCPSNITVSATGSGGTIVYYTVNASGGCNPPPFVYSYPPSGSTFPVGPTTVYTSASDSCGNYTNCSFTVNVTASNCVMSIYCPSNIVVTSSVPISVYYNVSANDSCGGAVNTISTPPSGSLFGLGTTVVNCTAYDSYATNSCSFTVTVVQPVYSPIVLNCLSNITVAASSSSGATVFFNFTATGGCSPPPNVVANPPSGSTFPVGTTTVFVTASDTCGNSTNCSFTVTVNPQLPVVNEYFSTTAVLPPPYSMYISPAQWHMLYANGIIIHDVRHHFFTLDYPLPALGTTLTEVFSSQLDFNLSTDNGVTFVPATGTANVTVTVTHSQDANGVSYFSTEMLQLDMTILPNGFMLRESPTLQSLGQTTVRPVSGGYMISSFFDIFTEISTDGGNSWTPAPQAGHVEMRPDPAYAPVAGEPTQLLPAPNDAYVSPAQWHALYGQGIVIKNVSHKFFTGSLLPPTSGVTNIHSFNSILDLDISTDGGNTFQSVRANAPVQVSVANASASTDNPLYDTEMTSLNLTGLPNGIMVRESPTLPSRGMTQINSQSDGTFKVNSFFDIFTELSLDGGATWSPATNGAIRMQLTQRAPEVTTVNGLLPLTNRPYVSPTQWHAAYANGIYISNVTHSAFTANYPPPAPGATNIENFNSTVSGLISTDGGHTFNPFSAPAAVSVNVASHSSLDNNNTRFFDTEMTSMSLSGGNLPGGIMVRESPTKQSLGRTSVRNDSTGYHISSFFDIFTEVSLDGGNTWSAATTQPATMSPTNPPAIGPSSNVQITKTASANSISIGGVVNFIITVTNLGPNASTNINVLDVLPPGLSYDFTSGSSCGPYNPTNGQLTIPVLAAGSACSLTITATATNLGTFTNTATITSASPPNTNANYSASAVVTVTLPPADLVVTKLVSTNAAGPYTNAIVAYAGQTIYFQIGIQNAGPANPTNIVINDPLPPGLTYVASTQYPYNTNTGVWTIGTLVGNGAYFMYLDCVATNLGTFTNLATVPVPSGVTDPNLSNNTASAFVTVTLPPADLFVTKGVSTNAGGPYTSLLSVPTGQMFYFQIGIGNNGPNIASNVVINDLLPPGLTYVTNFTGNPYTYNTNTGVWTVGTVYPNSGTGYMYLVAVAGSGGMVTNAATVPVPNGMSDPNLTNNTGNAIVQVYPVYSISGYVRGCQSNGPAMPFVNVKLSGAATGSTLTTSNGFYSFSNLVSGTYTITPTHPSDTFSPASASLTLNSNTTLPVFTTSTTEIRGRLTYGTNGAPVIGAEVDLTGAAKHATVTDANGVYYFNAALGPGNYTVTPVATNGFVYTPTNANVTISATNCVAQANFNAANRSVLLVAIEVNQAIQDWSNSVPLVKDKATVVRAFLQLPNATNPPVLLQGARLVGTSGGSSLGMPQPPMNTNGVFLVNTTNAAAGRSNLVNSLNFRVPAAWLSGTITLQFVCTNNVTVIPTNVVPANSAVTVTFSPVATPQVKFFGINWTNPAGAAQNISGATMQSMVDRMLATYPVAGVDAKFTSLTLSSASLQGNKSPLGDDTANAYPSLNKINSGLALLRILDSLFVPVGNRIYYGALAGLDYTASGPQKRPSYGSAIGIPGVSASSFTPLDPYGWPGSAAIPGTVGVGTGRQTASHELGHDLGLSHAANGALYGYVTYVKVGTNWVRMVTPGISNNATALTVSALGKCGDPARTNYVYPLFQPLNGVQVPALGPLTNGVNALVFGLDTLTLDTTNKEPVLSPFQYFDLMSYCRGGLEDRWASVFTYQTLLAAINANFTAPPPPPPLGQLRRWLFVRGQVDDINDAAEFQPFVAVDTAEIPPSPPAGSYYLMLRDANGNLLETISFAPTPGEDEDESQPALDDFVIPIPIDLVSQPVPIREIQVSDGTNILSDIMGSTNFPSVSGVTVTATNGGAFTGSGILNLSWTGYDADPTAQLTYTVQYSSAGSTNWLTLAADLTSTMFSIDSQYLAATAQGQMRVIVSDGFNVSDPAYSATFPVNYHAPTVTLYAPMTGSYYVGDQQLYLSASANDPQDGMLTGASLQWTSSLNGPLGSGTTVALEADTLSEGMHLITVTATDAEGLTNSAQAAIYVVRQSPPTLAIQQIGNQIQLTWPSSVTNYVLESTTQLLPMNWTSVTNVPVAADLLQTVNLNLSTTNRFFRLRMP